MADRQITATGKDSGGDITRLCHFGQWWSPVSKSTAIEDIERGYNTYFVRDRAGNRADIHVVTVGSKKYLRTNADASSANNLDNLPDC